MNEISSKQRAGYILGLVVAFANIPAALIPGGVDDSGSPVGPPLPIVLFGVVVGLATMVLLALAWRTDRRGYLRAAAVLMILVALTAVPAFPIPTVPAWVKLVAGTGVLATLVSLVLLFSPARKPEVALR